jgi:hypothetical protein
MRSRPRTDEEIDKTLAELRKTWRSGWNRHLRLCQLVVVATRRDDPFYIEDAALRAALRARRALEGDE